MLWNISIQDANVYIVKAKNAKLDKMEKVNKKKNYLPATHNFTYKRNVDNNVKYDNEKYKIIVDKIINFSLTVLNARWNSLLEIL